MIRTAVLQLAILTKQIVEVVQIFVDIHLNSLFIDLPILKHRSATHISHSS